MSNLVNKAGVRGCPVCDADWDGGSILEEFIKQRDAGGATWAGMDDAAVEAYVKKSYSPPYRWGREVGIEIQGGYDGISYYQCPDCNGIFDRFTGKQVNPTPKGTPLSTYHHSPTKDPNTHAYFITIEPDIMKLWLINDIDSDKNEAYEGRFDKEHDGWYLHASAGKMYKFPAKGIKNMSEVEFLAAMGAR